MELNKLNIHGQSVDVADEYCRNKIGVGDLQTSSQTLIGGVNELHNKIGVKVLTTDDKTLTGGVNEVHGKVGEINATLGDEELTTESKTVSGAINELKESIDTNGGSSNGGEFLIRSSVGLAKSSTTVQNGEMFELTYTDERFTDYQVISACVTSAEIDNGKMQILGIHFGGRTITIKAKCVLGFLTNPGMTLYYVLAKNSVFTTI